MFNSLFGTESVDDIMSEFVDKISRLRNRAAIQAKTIASNEELIAKLNQENDEAEAEGRKATLIADKLQGILDGQ